MLPVLTLLSWVGAVVGFVFMTLCIASGLYYLSEFVEEHAEFAKRTLQRLIYIVIALHFAVAIFDKFPFFTTAFSIAAHYVYSTNLKTFPFISLTSTSFIASCVMVLIDHFLFFRHFSKYPPRGTIARHYLTSEFRNRDYELDVPTFGQVAAFFGICVWLVPFGLFISLSAGELTLPTVGSDGRMGLPGPGRRSQGLVKQVVTRAGNWINRKLENLGWASGAAGGVIGGYDRYR